MVRQQHMWDQLNDELDLIVIGGGIVGTGIARDASLRGLKTALVEKGDLGAGTSSKSTKLVHGGMRYLEQYRFGLVQECVHERRILSSIAPHLVSPLGFMLPIYKGGRIGRWRAWLGVRVYHLLCLFRTPGKARSVNKDEISQLMTGLRKQNLVGGECYYDCSTNDARLTLENGLDVVSHGGIVVTRARVKGLVKGQRGEVEGVEIEGTKGQVKKVRCKQVVNATGPWMDEMRALNKEEQARMIFRTKGVHIVIQRHRLSIDWSLVVPHPVDGRIVFMIPWGAQIYSGTTDTMFEGQCESVCATSSDIEYLLEGINYYFPHAHIGKEDVMSTWSGLRALIGEGEIGQESESSREHEMRQESGMLSVGGGKLTTYRKMAKEVVDRAIAMIERKGKSLNNIGKGKTDKIVLIGAIGWKEAGGREGVINEVKEIVGEYLEIDSIENLVDTYGTKAMNIAKLVQDHAWLRERLLKDRPEIMAQVYWGVKQEMVTTVSDVLVRRTQLFFQDKDQGLGCTEKVADVLAELLGWSEEVKQKHVNDYRKEVSMSRQWKEDHR